MEHPPTPQGILTQMMGMYFFVCVFAMFVRAELVHVCPNDVHDLTIVMHAI